MFDLAPAIAGGAHREKGMMCVQLNEVTAGTT
jgi:hypothetical protein